MFGIPKCQGMVGSESGKKGGKQMTKNPLYHTKKLTFYLVERREPLKALKQRSDKV